VEAGGRGVEDGLKEEERRENMNENERYNLMLTHCANVCFCLFINF
jgi:hypothetical protein